jgi:hypothetical protein
MFKTVENTEVHMFQKWFKVLRALLGVLMLVAIVAFSGCEAAPPEVQAIEQVTPTGCLKTKGRYYDPKTKECVQATSHEQALVLDVYRYVHEIALEGKLSEAKYHIDFSRYMPVEEAEVLWSELRNQGAKMVVLSARMPDDKTYDPRPGEERRDPGTIVWNGSGQGCGWHEMDNPNSTGKSSLYELMLENLDHFEADPEWGRPHPELRKGMFEDKQCRVYSMVVIAKPTVMRDFWDRHLDDVSWVMPQVKTIDGVIRNPFATKPLKEGE